MSELLTTDEANIGDDLRSYFRVFSRRRWWIMASVVSLAGLSMFIAVRETPLYRAKARLLLGDRQTEGLRSGVRDNASDSLYGGVADRIVQTEVEVLTSRPLRDRVRKSLPGAPRAQAAPFGRTNIIEVSVVSIDPKLARAAANKYAQSYVRLRREQAVQDLLDAAKALDSKLGEFRRSILTIDAKLQGIPDTSSNNLERSSILAEREALTQQQALFARSISDLQVDAGLKTGGVQTLELATLPTEAFAPDIARRVFYGFLFGLVLGMALAAVVEFLDDSIKRRQELERFAPGLSVLSIIPRFASDKTGSSLIPIINRGEVAAEAYRAVRTALQFLTIDSPHRVIEITSSMPGEGKSTTAANLAIVLAQADQRVVLVDGDLRRPTVHQIFNIEGGHGLTSVITESQPLRECIRRPFPDLSLAVLPSGPLPPNPAELLASPRFRAVLDALSAESDWVIVDTPPVLPVTDATVVAQCVDGVIVVARSRRSKRSQFKRCIELLARINAPVLGTLLNAASTDEFSRYGGYSSEYKYYADPERNPERNPG